MSFILPDLPYAKNALEPYIKSGTIDFHYGKHHQAYVNNLNNLIRNTDLDSMSLEEIITSSEGGVFNNAAQIWNHTFYWESLTPNRNKMPFGELKSAIENSFNSFDEFKDKFSKAAATLFGSGWAWLVKNEEGKLLITQESNAGNPLNKGLIPLLTCDVWEHAYYLDYQNRRPDYISAFWELVNWEKVFERFE